MTCPLWETGWHKLFARHYLSLFASLSAVFVVLESWKIFHANIRQILWPAVWLVVLTDPRDSHQSAGEPWTWPGASRQINIRRSVKTRSDQEPCCQEKSTVYFLLKWIYLHCCFSKSCEAATWKVYKWMLGNLQGTVNNVRGNLIHSLSEHSNSLAC